jgi:hypothetical protein
LGDPEIEVHVHGPQTGSDPQYGKDLHCSGDRVGFPRGFNQDGNFWSGDALVATDAELAAINAASPNGYNVSVWEDDNDVCTLKTGDDPWQWAQRLAAISTAISQGIAIKRDSTLQGYLLRSGTFLGSVYATVQTFTTKDDFLGRYVNATSLGLSFGDANHALRADGQSAPPDNGRGMLVSKPQH